MPEHYSVEAESFVSSEPAIERAQRRLRHANTVEEGKSATALSGADLFRNPEYEQKIAGLQAEFQALLNEPSPRKPVH